jgi:hypothetical protein
MAVEVFNSQKRRLDGVLRNEIVYKGSRWLTSPIFDLFSTIRIRQSATKSISLSYSLSNKKGLYGIPTITFIFR